METEYHIWYIKISHPITQICTVRGYTVNCWVLGFHIFKKNLIIIHFHAQSQLSSVYTCRLSSHSKGCMAGKKSTGYLRPKLHVH